MYLREIQSVSPVANDNCQLNLMVAFSNNCRSIQNLQQILMPSHCICLKNSNGGKNHKRRVRLSCLGPRFISMQYLGKTKYSFLYIMPQFLSTKSITFQPLSPKVLSFTENQFRKLRMFSWGFVFVFVVPLWRV